MTTSRAVLAGLLGAVVGSALVLTALSAPHVSGPIAVWFDGVALTTTYLNGSAQIFGPTSQNACNETLPVGPQWPNLHPDCPALLTGGTAYDLIFLDTGNPGYSPGLWTNITVTAPFNFSVDPGYIGQVPTSYSTSTGLYTGGSNMLFDQGEWIGSALVFTMPNDLSSPSTGLWLHATLVVQPTNETTYPGQ